MKPISLRVFGGVMLGGVQTVTMQITSRRTGRRYAIGVALYDDHDSRLGDGYANRLVVTRAWRNLRGFFRTDRGNPHPLQAIHIEGTVSI